MRTQDELRNFFEGFNAQTEAREEAVNRPSHYVSDTGMEAIDVIEAFDLNFNLGNALKYILRAGKKDDEAQDLKKALWYIKRQINNVREEE